MPTRKTGSAVRFCQTVWPVFSDSKPNNLAYSVISNWSSFNTVPGANLMGLNYLGAPGAPGGRGYVKVYPGPLGGTEIPDVGDCSRSLCAGNLGETVKGAN